MSDPFSKNPNPANIFMQNTKNNPAPNMQSNQQTPNNQMFLNNQNSNPPNTVSAGNPFAGNGSKPSGGTTIFNNFSGASNNNPSISQNTHLNNLNKPANNPSGQSTNMFSNPIPSSSNNNIFQGNQIQNNQAITQGSLGMTSNQTNPTSNSAGSVNPLTILSKASGTNLLQAVSNPSTGPTLNLNPNPNSQTSNAQNNLFIKNNTTNTQATTTVTPQNQQGLPQNPASQAQQSTNANMGNLFNMNKNTTGTGVVGNNNAGGTGIVGNSNTGGNIGGTGGAGTTNNAQTNPSGNALNNLGTNNQGVNQNSQGNSTANQGQGSSQPQNSNNSNGANLFANNNANNNNTGVQPPKDNYEIQFDKSNQTIDELIEEFKMNLKNSYEELKKLGEKTIKFLDERQDFIKIEQHFTEVEKMLVGNSEDVLKSLDNLQRQQKDILQQVEGISRKIGEGQYTHQLTTTLQQYGELKKKVIELHQQEGQWKDPGQQQLINLFDSLNQVEMQIKEMDQLVDVYLAHS